VIFCLEKKRKHPLGPNALKKTQHDCTSLKNCAYVLPKTNFSFKKSSIWNEYFFSLLLNMFIIALIYHMFYVNHC
jgi:hypothetical protein